MKPVTREEEKRLEHLVDELARLPLVLSRADARYTEAQALVERSILAGLESAQPRKFFGLVPRFIKD